MLISLLIVKPGGSWLAALMGIAAIVLLLIYYFNQMKTNDQKSSILDVSTSFLYGFWLIIIMTGLASLASVLFALRKPSEQEMITTVPPMSDPPEMMDL
jgi:ABC-type methionine transport system permease subunit